MTKQGPQADVKAVHSAFGVTYGTPPKPKLSKEARQLLEEECEAREAMASTKDDKISAAALRMLLTWHDQERLQP